MIPSITSRQMSKYVTQFCHFHKTMLVCITGPCASGKTKLARNMARSWNQKRPYSPDEDNWFSRHERIFPEFLEHINEDKLDKRWTVVSADTFRYKKNTWVKLPKEEFIRGVQQHIDNLLSDPGSGVIFEGLLYDETDPEHARFELMKLMMERSQLRIFFDSYISHQDQERSILWRTVSRFCGDLPKPEADESVQSVRRLVQKKKDHWDEMKRAFDEFDEFFHRLFGVNRIALRAVSPDGWVGRRMRKEK